MKTVHSPYAKRTWSLIAFTFFLGKLLTFVDLLVQRWKNFFFIGGQTNNLIMSKFDSNEVE